MKSMIIIHCTRTTWKPMNNFSSMSTSIIIWWSHNIENLSKWIRKTSARCATSFKSVPLRWEIHWSTISIPYLAPSEHYIHFAHISLVNETTTLSRNSLPPLPFLSFSRYTEILNDSAQQNAICNPQRCFAELKMNWNNPTNNSSRLSRLRRTAAKIIHTRDCRCYCYCWCAGCMTVVVPSIPRIHRHHMKNTDKMRYSSAHKKWRRKREKWMYALNEHFFGASKFIGFIFRWFRTKWISTQLPAVVWACFSYYLILMNATKKKNVWKHAK